MGMEQCARGTLSSAGEVVHIQAAAGVSLAAPDAAPILAAAGVPLAAPDAGLRLPRLKVLTSAVYALDESSDRELTRLEQKFVDKRTEQERANAAATIAAHAEEAAQR